MAEGGSYRDSIEGELIGSLNVEWPKRSPLMALEPAGFDQYPQGIIDGVSSHQALKVSKDACTRGNRSAGRVLCSVQEIDFSHDYRGVSADGSDCPFPHLNEAAAQRVRNTGCPHVAASFLGRPRRRGGEAAWAMVSVTPKEGPPRPSTHDSISTRRYLTDRPALTGEGHPAGAGR